MNILDNPLVKKYFGCEGNCTYHTGLNIAPECMALRVLVSMSEPINVGDRYLYIKEFNVGTSISSGGGIEEVIAESGWFKDGLFHPLCLRLPDKFQKPEKCCLHGSTCPEPGPLTATEANRPTMVKPSPERKDTQEVPCDCRGKVCAIDHACWCHLGPQKGWDNKPEPDAVEEKIKEISGWFKSGTDNQFKKLVCFGLENTLRELVRIVKEPK